MSSFSNVFREAPVQKSFPLRHLLHLEERPNGLDDAEVEVVIDPTAVDMKYNASVSHSCDKRC